MDDEKKRSSWDEYFMDIVETVSERATCDRGRAACVITKNKRIVSTGYVGAPVGLPHCDEVGHLMKKVYDEEGNESNHCIRTTHAEANAILKVASSTQSCKGATLYITLSPCKECSKLIHQAGIVRVVYAQAYKDDSGLQFMKKAGIELKHIEI